MTRIYTAQKSKVYDMYARFYRWAFDRLDNNGIVAFITNRSFIDSRAFDGFRRTVQDEFDYAYIIDTKSDVRANPKIAGTTHNVFGIQTGVAIMFLAKKSSRDKKKPCAIYYVAMEDEWRKEIKLQWLAENHIQKIPFLHIHPDKKNNWINLTDNDFETLLPLVDKAVKSGNSKKALFELYTSTFKTNRDEWVFDFDKINLKNKIQFFISRFNFQIESGKFDNDELDYSIKWSRDLKIKLKRKLVIDFSEKKIIDVPSRPFIKKKFYSEKLLNDVLTDNHYQISSKDLLAGNLLINIPGETSIKPFQSLATSFICDYSFLEATQCLPLYRYDISGNRLENITDWGLNKFVQYYGKKGVSKLSIFYYVYAVLHNTSYRAKYERNLKREYPRIPFYEDFKQWSAWGKILMDLHINYETVEPFKLNEVTTDIKESPKTKLKADKEGGTIFLDENTALTGIPKEAWTYKLGNRSALEWILDQYKESKPKDPTIGEKFNTYKFADYKQKVIDLVKRVCTVSVETMKIINEMEKVKS